MKAREFNSSYFKINTYIDSNPLHQLSGYIFLVLYMDMK